MKKTVLFSIIHMFVDGLCAFAMIRVSPTGYGALNAFLVYNFCAFVLQMPIGAVIDGLMMREGNEKLPVRFALLGVLTALLGALMLLILPAAGVSALLGVTVLGIGNALFHVGGGVGSIIEDRQQRKRGQNLGLFVAPGALGLFLGAKLKAAGPVVVILIYVLVCAAVLALLYVTYKGCEADTVPLSGEVARPFGRSDLFLIAGCFLVVILRSYIGFNVSMPWKTGAVLPLVAVLCVVLGKFMGGLLAARFNVRLVIVVTLLISAVCYAFKDVPAAGLLALLFFNTTMPVTLYLLVNRFKTMPGFYFGLLTVALFIGYVPSHLSYEPVYGGSLTGALGCVLSMLFLVAAASFTEKTGAAA